MTGWANVASMDITALARAVNNTPTLIGLDATDWSGYASGVKRCSDYVTTSNTRLNHAVVAVGYVNGANVNGVSMDYWIVRVSGARVSQLSGR